METGNRYHNSKSVKERFGDISDMALWRWLQNDTLDFPKPVYINKRRYWKEKELAAFEHRMEEQSHAAA